METKKTSKSTTLNTNRNFTMYSATRTLCRHSSKSIFGANRRYC